MLQAPTPPPPPSDKPKKQATAPAEGGGGGGETPVVAPTVTEDEAGTRTGQVEAVTINEDGSLVSAVYLDKILALWTTSSGELITQRYEVL